MMYLSKVILLQFIVCEPLASHSDSTVSNHSETVEKVGHVFNNLICYKTIMQNENVINLVLNSVTIFDFKQSVITGIQYPVIV